MQCAAMDVDVIKIILGQFGVKQRYRDIVLDGFWHLGCGGEAQYQQLA